MRLVGRCERRSAKLHRLIHYPEPRASLVSGRPRTRDSAIFAPVVAPIDTVSAQARFENSGVFQPLHS